MYIELHASSAFSFLEAASLPETLIDRAADLGYPALALLDRDGVFGAPRFHKAATAAGIRPIIGAELTMTGTIDLWRLPVLVESPEGYRNLCQLVTLMKLRAPKGEGALVLEELAGRTAGLVALAGREALVDRHFGVGGLVDRLIGLFGRANVCIELQRHLLRDEEADTQALIDLASAFHVPVVATNGVRFSGPDERPLFDVLTCIRHGTDLARAGRRLSRNAERYLKPPEEMARLFSDQPAAVAASAELAERLQYTLADLGYRFPAYPVPPGETMSSFLRKVTEVGARERYRPYHERARAQIARELDLIEKLDLAGYFLIVWDIVNFCRQQRILAQGRGSAANSAVCYSLGITAVDPVGMELLFERFLSEERGEWPDIDLDLPSGDRRERVIQHVYEKYGRHGAAMTANVITYRGRSAAREVGKTLGLEAGQIDRLAKVMNHFEFRDPGETLSRHLAEVGLDADQSHIRLFADLWQRIQDLPRHLGQHSGGMVICQGQLDTVVPLENASMPGRVVVQWDKDDCADMGIVKIDLLGLGMMAVIQDTLETVNSASGDATGHVAPGSLALDRAGRSPASAALEQTRDVGSASPVAVGVQDRRIPPSPTADRRPTPRVSTPCRLLPSIARLATLPAQPIGCLDGGAPGHVAKGDFEVCRGSPARHGQTHRTGPPLDLWNIPPDDPEVYRMLQAADTVGVFQVESRAQMATLPRLRPERFYDLVVEVALIRPGPVVGQMVHPYLNRRAGREPVTYPHPALEPILKRTLGVPLFQEQILRIAMVAAGFSGGQAEELRRAFSFKRSERRMKQVEVRLWEGMAKQGITGEAAEQIVKSITSFALYGFPESHSASFALLVYASAYLRAHFPAAFAAAILNNQPMGFYRPATLVKDAQRHGVHFAPIDVDRSDWLCQVEDDGAVRLGLCYVTGLRREVGLAIARRSRPTPSADAHRFHSVEDLIAKTGVNREELATLAEIGALNSFGFDRREALWQVERAIRPAGALFAGRDQEPGARGQRDTLVPGSWSLAPDRCPLLPMTASDRLVSDYEGTGLTIGPHPMAMRRQELSLRGVLRAADLPGQRHGRRVRVAGAVITRQRPGTAKGFVFLTLEDETGIANIIIRPDVFAGKRLTIIEEPFLLIEGTLQNLDGVTSVRAERLEGLGGTPVEIDARDFY